MRDPVHQPQRCIQRVAPDDRTCKADTALDHNPSLQCIDGDGTKALGQCNPVIECLANHPGLPPEMVSQSISTTRVPEVLSDKPMATFRTLP